MKGSKAIPIRVPQVKPGMILSADVFSGSGAVLLARDTILTSNIISQLRLWQIESVDVRTEGVEGNVKDEVKPDDAQTTHSKEDQAFFDMYMESVESITEMFEELRTADKVPVKECLSVAEGILDQVLGVQGVLRRLRQVKTGDEYTFTHSLNVGIYSVLIGTWLDYSVTELRLLAMAGLLHDAGKMKVPASIVKKPGRLSGEEFTEIKRHPFYSYQMVANTPGMPQKIAVAALQHHERENGTGYPLQLSSPTIIPMAKVIAIADIYDAVTSNRCYQAGRPPHVAANIIMEESYSSLDPLISHKFLERMTPYFFNVDIRLNNGMVGRVIQVNRLSPTRPLIQTEQGFIDLEKTPELKIVDVV